MDLSAKVAVVTGGGRGIGECICEVLAKQGAKVVLCDIDLEGAKEVSRRITGEEDTAFRVDVSQGKEVEECFEAIISRFSSIDILVNNAGITQDRLVLRMKDSDWRRVMDVNLTGVFNCIRAASKRMIKKRQGRIVNISSTVALRGNIGQANYAASKAGIIGLTKSVALELAPFGINVNTICPGFIDTEMTKGLSKELKDKILEKIPLSRFGTPMDIANMVAFLASDYSSYITGAIFVVDGGMTI